MSVEVRQMIIKSNVLQGREAGEPQAGADDDKDHRSEILEECRRLIVETLREMKER